MNWENIILELIDDNTLIIISVLVVALTNAELAGKIVDKFLALIPKIKIGRE